MSNTLSAINGTKYQITYTVTNRTAGSFTVSFGGNTSQSITESGNFNVNATANTTLTITPTADFNGTIILSVKIYGIATNPYNQNGYNVNKLTTKWSQFPDYTNGSARSINTSYQEKQDGFLFVEITLNLSLNSGICITLNGVTKNFLYHSALPNGAALSITKMIPITKTDTYSFSPNYSYPSVCNITFYPTKGEK